jgi:hypothetical protein
MRDCSNSLRKVRQVRKEHEAGLLIGTLRTLRTLRTADTVLVDANILIQNAPGDSSRE